ncbi:hypothetical protein SDC9_152980 [bioreactor metagenome]|uniref:Uncharacterized protein n=1 Tax=bioreactor metagenome TaxID=1076179 RepID=A0A645EV50_9ZZZZ
MAKYDQRQGDIAPAGGDVLGKHAQLAQNQICAAQTAHQSVEQGGEIFDPKHRQAHGIRRLGIFTHGDQGQAPHGPVEKPQQEAHQKIQQIGDNVLVKKGLAHQGQLAETGNRQHGKRINLRIAPRCLVHDDLEQVAGQAHREKIQCRAHHVLVLAQIDGEKCMDHAEKGAGGHAAQKAPK